MYRSLGAGAIGVQVERLADGLDLAARHGFAGYHFSIAEVAAMGATAALDLAESKGVKLSGWGFPLDFRGDEAAYNEGMQQLPGMAKVAAEVGVLRTATWIMPASDERTYEENFSFHLAHNMEQMGELCRAIGPNMGFLLDSWHWYTSHETVEDLRSLTAEQVVDVHINDAPVGVDVDEQLDNVRDLPGATGVIDIATFLRALQGMGYDGPVMVEPFSQRIRDMESEDAVAATAKAMDEVWEQAGLS